MILFFNNPGKNVGLPFRYHLEFAVYGLVTAYPSSLALTASLERLEQDPLRAADAQAQELNLLEQKSGKGEKGELGQEQDSKLEGRWT